MTSQWYARPQVLLAALVFAITLGVWALGFVILTALYRIALGVRKETEA